MVTVIIGLQTSSTDFDFGTGDFTLEAYIYTTHFQDTNNRMISKIYSGFKWFNGSYQLQFKQMELMDISNLHIPLTIKLQMDIIWN